MPYPLPFGVLGGTFDPPHSGHLALAECARVQFALGRVLFVPAGDPWRKTGSGPRPEARGPSPSPTAAPTESGQARDISPAAHRLAMVRLAIAGNPAFAVDERELRRPGPSYTVDTLEELRAELGAESSIVNRQSSIVLVLGADALDDLPHWKDPARIFELARVAVAPRPGHPAPTAGPSALTVEMPPLAITSSDIRARLAAGKPIRYLVPDAVAAYIAEHGLYRPG
ncbi:MAG: nicotinate (nicotinamide) nucleotide adenylyltransferase [Tepidiformaceae bacterium]